MKTYYRKNPGECVQRQPTCQVFNINSNDVPTIHLDLLWKQDENYKHTCNVYTGLRRAGFNTGSHCLPSPPPHPDHVTHRPLFCHSLPLMGGHRAVDLPLPNIQAPPAPPAAPGFLLIPKDIPSSPGL